MPLAPSRTPRLVADAVVPAPVPAERRGARDLAGYVAHTQFARPSARAVPHPPRSTQPLGAPASDVLRIVSDSRTPVFVTVHDGGRIRYGYWRPVGTATGRGGCYVALPTDVCEELRSGGRIALGDPVTDPSKTTYRVRPARPEGKTGREERRAA
ncbi:cell envelope biogenesis protein OmpA [Streptomyces sp. NPDC007808]|uniref:cell envelope biogenesis protein OmpA n=1 Tax=Streptomyces sp. NPDC007808 TaxID=3364779 RepID=UPI00369A38F9